MEESCPEKRIHIKKKMPGELTSDEPISNPLKNYEINLHNRILDLTIDSKKSRFEKHGDIYKDLACLSPLNFHEVQNLMPSDALEKLSIVLQRFGPDATKDQLQGGLLGLARNWVIHLKVMRFEEYPIVRENESDDEDSNKVCIPQETGCQTCKNCAVCVYLTLERYNLFSASYKTIFLAYNYLLTLLTAQVACAKSYLILKFVKNRLRSPLRYL